jgi:hypothetical protein
VLSFLSTLPEGKRQPNLLFAAARYLLHRPPGIGELRALVGRDGGELASLMLARRAQTNEHPRRRPASCPAWLSPPTRSGRSCSPAMAARRWRSPKGTERGCAGLHDRDDHIAGMMSPVRAGAG